MKPHIFSWGFLFGAGIVEKAGIAGKGIMFMLPLPLSVEGALFIVGKL
jgi:hypothetical protein